jgi:hypothetical protein
MSPVVVGLWQRRSRHRRPLTGAERECCYRARPPAQTHIAVVIAMLIVWTARTHKLPSRTEDKCLFPEAPSRCGRCGVDTWPMELLRFLPIAPWLRAPFSVVVLLVVAIGFARWLPLALGDVYENWRRLVHTIRRPGEPGFRS